MAYQPLQIYFLFIRSCNFNWKACVTSFSTLSGASFMLVRVINFLVTLTSLSKMTSSLWNWLLLIAAQNSWGYYWPSLGFLFISSRFLLRPYDVTTTSNLLFVHSFMQFQLKCVRDVIFCSQWSEFFLFISVIKFFLTLDLPHSQKRLPHFEIDFFFTSEIRSNVWSLIYTYTDF